MAEILLCNKSTKTLRLHGTLQAKGSRKKKKNIKRLKIEELFSFVHFMTFSGAIREINETHFVYSGCWRSHLDSNKYIILHQSNLKRGNRKADAVSEGFTLMVVIQVS